MGLIKAALGAAGGVMADQWKEFFYCEALGKDVLVTKGQKRITGRSSNTKGNDNIISNGSGIAVADGQCDRGIVVCTSGIGISIAANKVPGIRCALCTDPYMAKMTRLHNDANMLALGGGIVGKNLAIEIVETFLNTEFSEGENHVRRIAKLED